MKIKKINNKINKTILCNSKKYFFYYYLTGPNYKLKLPLNSLISIYVINSKKNSLIKNENKIIKFNKLEIITISNIKNLLIENGPVEFVLIGKKLQKKLKKEIRISKNKIINVIKPWGKEQWIVKNNYFVFKNIYIKKNFQTSLQFHNFKKETNFLFNGKAKLFYKKDKKIINKNLKEKNVSSFDFPSKSYVNINPNIVHRIKAITNINLLEASTPEVDDVIRISDDTNRKDGKILKEHKLRTPF